MEYTMGKRRRTNFLDLRGIAVDGYRVWFVMADGTPDYVEIEKNQFNADSVRAAIEQKIEEHLDVVGS